MKDARGQELKDHLRRRLIPCEISFAVFCLLVYLLSVVHAGLACGDNRDL